MNKFLKRFLILFFALFFIQKNFSFAQNLNNNISENISADSKNEKNENEIPTEKKSITANGFFKLGSALTLNLADKTQSAPSPINFTIGGGAKIKITELISLEPMLDFYSMYYLFYDGRALPAEVEHRTSSVLCFLLDVPVGFNFYLGNSKNANLSCGLGLAFLLRFSFLANGVKSNDEGFLGSAKSDDDEIKKYFWQKARFIYPEIFAAFDYKISEKLSAGIIAKFYLPVTSLFEGHGFDSSIFSISTRFTF